MIIICLFMVMKYKMTNNKFIIIDYNFELSKFFFLCYKKMEQL